jgi:Zn-dependent protease with chaperone function
VATIAYTSCLRRNRIASGVLALLLGVVFVACGVFAALPLATLRSLILDPSGLTVPFSWVLGLGGAFVLGGLFMVVSQLQSARKLIATLPHARSVDDPALVQAVTELSDIAGLKVRPPLLVLPATEPNAFAYGIGRDSSSIAVTQGMIDLLSAEELRGVLAHELSHIANEDTRLITLVEAVNRTSATLRQVADRGGFGIGFTDAARYAPPLIAGALVLYLANRFGPELAQGSWGDSTFAPLLEALLGVLVMGTALVVFFKLARKGWKALAYMALYVLVGFVPFVELFANPVIGVLLGRGISRQREFIADTNATLLTGDPLALISALRKLEAHPTTTLSQLVGARYAMFSPIEVSVPRRWSRLYATHPTLRARRERLEALVGTA